MRLPTYEELALESERALIEDRGSCPACREKGGIDVLGLAPDPDPARKERQWLACCVCHVNLIAWVEPDYDVAGDCWRDCSTAIVKTWIGVPAERHALPRLEDS